MDRGGTGASMDVSVSETTTVTMTSTSEREKKKKDEVAAEEIAHHCPLKWVAQLRPNECKPGTPEHSDGQAVITSAGQERTPAQKQRITMASNCNHAQQRQQHTRFRATAAGHNGTEKLFPTNWLLWPCNMPGHQCYFYLISACARHLAV